MSSDFVGFPSMVFGRAFLFLPPFFLNQRVGNWVGRNYWPNLLRWVKKIPEKSVNSNITSLRGNVQNSLAKELYIVSYTTFETIKETSISSFKNSRSILELECERSRVFKTRVLSKKNFTYSGVFKPYSDVLMSYSGVFLQKNFISAGLWSPIVAFLSPIVTFYVPIAAFLFNLWKSSL